jgi:LmbE family N-acetylglucosaminyl deacetylase
MIGSNERILVLAAHPDDEVLGCGGMIAQARKSGAAVRIVFMAEGITARHDPQDFDRPDVIAAIEKRETNGLKALALLGVAREEIFFERRFCCRLDQVPQIDLVKQMERHIGEFQPTRIFGHAAGDTNVDHGLSHRAMLAACRPIGRDFLKAIYAFEVPSSTDWNPLVPFAPNAFLDISATIELKLAAMEAYGDEMRAPPHPRSRQVLEALARVRGAHCGAHFAEGFILVRSRDL